MSQETCLSNGLSHAEEPAKKKDKCSVWGNLDVHGLATWSEMNQCAARISWTIILIAACTSLCYGLYKNSLDYWYNPILTSISIVPKTSMQFPDIYICPSNYINETYALEKPIDSKWASYFINSAVNASGNDILNEKATVWERFGISGPQLQNISEAPDDYQSFFMNIGYRADEFLKECRFLNEDLHCGHVTQSLFDRNRGKCFLLKINRTQGTPNVGLSLVLNIHTELYPQLLDIPPPLFDGIFVSIDYGFDPASYNFQLVGPGAYTKISLELQRIMLKNVERTGMNQRCVYSESADTDDRNRQISDRLKILNAEYSLEACQMDCGLQAVLETCGCILAVDKLFLRDLSLPICTPNTMNSCVFAEVISAFKNRTSNQCVNECFPPCNSWVFTSQVSQLKFPSRTLREKTGHDGGLQSTLQDWADNYILLDISFSKLQYTEITQTMSMTFETFISNVGGQMGIWLGASLLTVVQALVLMITYTANRLHATVTPA